MSQSESENVSSATAAKVSDREPEFLGFASEFDTDTAPVPAIVWWGGAVLICLLGSLAFVNAIGGGFLWVDRARIVDDVRLRSEVGLAATWQHPFAAIDLPVGQALLWAEYHALGPGHAAGYRAVSLLLHLGLCLLTWKLFTRLRLRLAGLTAALLTVHPLLIASAALISNQPMLLSIIFSLTSALSFMGWNEARAGDLDEIDSRSFHLPGHKWILATSAALFMILAVATHGSAWVIPAAFVIRNLVTERDHPSGQTWGLLLISAIALVVPVTHWWCRGELRQSIDPLRNLSSIGGIVLLSAWRAVVPNRAFLDSLALPGGLLTWMGLVIVLAVLAWSWVRRGQRGRLPLLICLLMIVAALPAAFSVTFADGELLLGSSILVLPSAVFVAMIVAAVHNALSRIDPEASGIRGWLTARSFQRSVASAAVAALLTVSWLHTSSYADEPAVWERASAAKPWSAGLGVALGDALAAADQSASGLAGNRLDEATDAYQRVLDGHPRSRAALLGLTRCLAKQKKFDEAITLYRAGIDADPNDSTLFDGESEMYAANGIGSQALRLSQHAVELNPRDAAAHNDLAIQLDAADRLDEAAIHYGHAIAIDPFFCAPRINLATVWFRQGKLSQASDELVEVTKIDPRNFEAFANAGAMLASMKQWPRAEGMLRSALGINHNSAEAWQNLSVVLSQEGKPKEAAFARERATTVGN